MIELKQLRAFAALAEELHFGRAAARVHLTQPALSAQLRTLETRLGVALVFRTSRRVSLTRAGEAFLPEALATLAQAASAVEIARRTGAEGVEVLKLGGVDSATAGLLPELVRALRAARPAIDVSIAEMLSARTVHALHVGLLDVGFTRLPPDDPGLVSRHVLTERLWVAVATGHPLARGRAPRLAAVAAEPLVMPSRAHRPILHDVVRGFFALRGLEPRILQEVNERHVALGMVAAGLGIAIVPAWVRRFGPPGVAFLPLPGRAPTIRTHAVWRAAETLEAVHALVALLPTRPARPDR